MHSPAAREPQIRAPALAEGSPGSGKLRSFFLTSKTKIYYELLLAPPIANFSTYDTQR
jgi:hypothetical protein